METKFDTVKSRPIISLGRKKQKKRLEVNIRDYPKKKHIDFMFISMNDQQLFDQKKKSIRYKNFRISVNGLTHRGKENEASNQDCIGIGYYKCKGVIRIVCLDGLGSSIGAEKASTIGTKAVLQHKIFNIETIGLIQSELAKEIPYIKKYINKYYHSFSPSFREILTRKSLSTTMQAIEINLKKGKVKILKFGDGSILTPTVDYRDTDLSKTLCVSPFLSQSFQEKFFSKSLAVYQETNLVLNNAYVIASDGIDISYREWVCHIRKHKEKFWKSLRTKIEKCKDLRRDNVSIVTLEVAKINIKKLRKRKNQKQKEKRRNARIQRKKNKRKK